MITMLTVLVHQDRICRFILLFIHQRILL